MDDKQVARAKATIHTGIYNMEYAACFTKDSDGLFKRSLIESCVVNEDNPVVINDKPIIFDQLSQGILMLNISMGLTQLQKKIISVL